MIMNLGTFTDGESRADPRGMGSLEPTSPRSVEACLRLGIEPCELHFMPPDVFMEEFGDKELAQIAYSHHERIRQVMSAANALLTVLKHPRMKQIRCAEGNGGWYA